METTMTPTEKSETSEIEITTARIIGYAIYGESLALYPITVENWHQSPRGCIDFDYDEFSNPVTVVLPEPRLSWQVYATRDSHVVCLGVTDKVVYPLDWHDKALAALEEDDKAQKERAVRCRVATMEASLG